MHHRRVESSQRDRLNRPVFTWHDEPVRNVAVSEASVAEPAGEGTYRLVGQVELSFQGAYSVHPTDEFTIRDARYEVSEGSEGLSTWQNPFTGRVLGTTVRLKRVTG